MAGWQDGRIHERHGNLGIEIVGSGRMECVSRDSGRIIENIVGIGIRNSK